MEIEIPSSPEYVSIVRHAVEGVARRMEFSDEQIDDLKLAVGEACTNAIRHGCPCEELDTVKIRCLVAPDGLRVEVQNGISDCVSPKVPDEPDLTRIGGLGLYLIQQVMDEVDLKWERQCATVTMLKRLPSQSI